jgi:predicted alpha/beta superfamily hydrolase
MTHRLSLVRTIALAAAALVPALLTAQAASIPLTAAEWQATDSIRFEEHLGVPAVFINTGVALSRSARFRNGILEFDIAAGDNSTNMGISFRAADAENADVVFFRPGASGTDDAMQYAPSINSIPATWQLFHGPGANASVIVPRNKWIHVRMRVFGDSAAVYLNGDAAAVLVIPRLAGPEHGSKIGLWGSGFGKGAWYANITYAPDARSYAHVPATAPSGTLDRWEISQAFDASALVPGIMPAAAALRWDSLRADPDGMVIINRLRRSPGVLPYGLADSVLLDNRVPKSQVVFARTTITVPHDTTVLLDAGFSDNAVIFLDGRPLFSGIRPSGFNDLGYFEPLGIALFLTLHAGRNTLTYAVTEFFGGWALTARLRPAPQGAAVERVHSPAVTGDLRLHTFASTVFGNTRKLRVLLPDGYDDPANRDKHYAVLYLADGQNLFDPATGVFGPREWHVDEIVHDLVAGKKIPPMIVVGVDDAGATARDHEYLPWPDSATARINSHYDPAPEGKRYPEFLIDEVMPLINRTYRTLTDAAHTGIGGSSYGGAISVYTVEARPGVFGRLLAESTVYRVFGFKLIADAVNVRQWPGRIFLAVGTNEGNQPGCDRSKMPAAGDTSATSDDMVAGVLRMHALLKRAGLDSTRLKLVIAPCGTHTADAWAARLPQALTFLFGR